MNQNINYALIGLGELHSNFTTLEYISNKHKLSLDLLQQVFSLLRRYGIVESKKGPGGGYKLKLHPSKITLLEIMNCVHKTPYQNTYSDIAQRVYDCFNGYTLKDFINNNSEVLK